MRVDRLTLKEFTVFAEADFEFSSGLNVFIGANGTGKSHVLKGLFSVTRYVATNGPLLRALTEAFTEGEDTTDRIARASATLGPPILAGFEKTFRPEPDRPRPLASLVRHGTHESEFVVRGDFGTAAIGFGEGVAKTGFSNSFAPGHTVFLPANEVLSIYPGFIAAYERRELSFDETVRDLCVDLSASPLRSVSSPVLAEVVNELDEAVGGKTVLRGDRFYVLLSEVPPEAN